MSHDSMDAELNASASAGASDRPADSGRNRLIAALPQVHQQHLSRHLEEVHLSMGEVLAIPDEPIRFVYFPRGALASLIVPMLDGSAIEGAAIGNGGTTGLPIFLGQDIATEEITVQISGIAERISASTFRTVLGENAPLQALLRHYALALINHLVRTAGCNRLHSVRQRCARWLLMASDLVGAPVRPRHLSRAERIGGGHPRPARQRRETSVHLPEGRHCGTG